MIGEAMRGGSMYLPSDRALTTCLEQVLIDIRAIAWGDSAEAKKPKKERLDRIGRLADQAHNLPAVLGKQRTFLYSYEKNLVSQFERR